MPEDEMLFGYANSYFALVARTNVSAGVPNVHGVDRHGLERLRPRKRRRPQMPNALPEMIEQRLVSFSVGLFGACAGEVGREGIILYPARKMEAR